MVLWCLWYPTTNNSTRLPHLHRQLQQQQCEASCTQSILCDKSQRGCPDCTGGNSRLRFRPVRRGSGPSGPISACRSSNASRSRPYSTLSHALGHTRTPTPTTSHISELGPLHSLWLMSAEIWIKSLKIDRILV